MASKILRGALIGFGQIAEKAHWPVWKTRPGIKITAVAEANPERRTVAGAQIPDAKTYASLDELLAAESLDFVDIATPPALHTAQVLAALKKDVHVLCEKPLVLSAADFSRIRALATERDRTVFTVHNWSYAPIFEKAFALAAAGEVGTVTHVELHTLRTRPAVQSVPGAWRTQSGGGGIWIDHGWHASYLVRKVLKEAPEKISVKLQRPSPEAMEDEATVFIEFPNATALIRLTWRADARSNWGLIQGDRGALEIQDDTLVLRQGTKTQTFSFPEPLSQGSAHPEWFSAMLRDFEMEILDPKTRFTNLAEAGFAAELLDSVYAADRAPSPRKTPAPQPTARTLS